MELPPPTTTDNSINSNDSNSSELSNITIGILVACSVIIVVIAVFIAADIYRKKIRQSQMTKGQQTRNFTTDTRRNIAINDNAFGCTISDERAPPNHIGPNHGPAKNQVAPSSTDVPPAFQYDLSQVSQNGENHLAPNNAKDDDDTEMQGVYMELDDYHHLETNTNTTAVAVVDVEDDDDHHHHKDTAAIAAAGGNPAQIDEKENPDEGVYDLPTTTLERQPYKNNNHDSLTEKEGGQSQGDQEYEVARNVTTSSQVGESDDDEYFEIEEKPDEDQKENSDYFELEKLAC